jgi:hypothetical protein
MSKSGECSTYLLKAERDLINGFKLACYKKNQPMSDVLRNYMTEYSGNQSHKPLEFTSDFSQVHP